jgi:hypothetical protein
MTRGDQRCSEYFSRGVAGLWMLLGDPTRLEERSVCNKLFTVCMYGYDLAATALLQNMQNVELFEEEVTSSHRPGSGGNRRTPKSLQV